MHIAVLRSRAPESVTVHAPCDASTCAAPTPRAPAPCHRAASAVVERAFGASSARHKGAAEGALVESERRTTCGDRDRGVGRPLLGAIWDHRGETMRVLATHVGAKPRERHRPMTLFKRAGRIRSAGQEQRPQLGVLVALRVRVDHLRGPSAMQTRAALPKMRCDVIRVRRRSSRRSRTTAPRRRGRRRRPRSQRHPGDDQDGGRLRHRHPM